MIEIQNNNENKIRKVLKDELFTFVMFMGIISSIIWFGAGMKQDVALIRKDVETIKYNDLAHIQTLIDENKKQGLENTKVIQEINLKLERILVILDK